MLRILALLVVCSLAVLTGGCSGEKKPEADPNFKTTTNPSDITIPPQMMKMKPGTAKPEAPKS